MKLFIMFSGNFVAMFLNKLVILFMFWVVEEIV